MRRSILFLLFVVLVTGCFKTSVREPATPVEPATPTTESAQPAGPDQRLASFMERVIPEEAQREQSLRELGTVTLEQFIEAIYTHRVAADTTPDNSLALSQLGQYLEEARPPISSELLPRLRVFYESPGNQTMMRGLLLATLKELVAEHNGP